VGRWDAYWFVSIECSCVWWTLYRRDSGNEFPWRRCLADSSATSDRNQGNR